MRKRYLALVLALSSVLSLSACTGGPSPKESSPVNSENVSSYKAGTYTATEQGNNGSVTLAVTFSNDTIDKIEIVESAETNGLGSTAIEKLIGQILDGQTLAVDTIAGATNSSNAVLTIVKSCVEQAGGDVDALMISDSNIPGEVKELSTQLLVVGGGAAGLAAATRAAQGGSDVLLIEKMTVTGGAAAISGGGMQITGSKLQKELGVTDDTPEQMIEDFMVNGDQCNDVMLLTTYANNVGHTIDWLIDDIGLQHNGRLDAYAEYAYARVLTAADQGMGLTRTLREAAESQGVKIMTDTRAEHLIMENGAVVGVQAIGTGGTQYNIKADRVILATGGYGNDKDLLQGDLKYALYYGFVGSTGDGHKMAGEVGAAFQNMEYGKVYPNGIESSPGVAKIVMGGSVTVCKGSAILVNAAGNRVVDEMGEQKVILKALNAQPEKELFLVMDAATFETFRTAIAAKVPAEFVDEYLANNGSKAPIFAHGDTLEEAAQAAGVDAANLKAAVERFNAMVDTGTDEDFGRSSEYLQTKIGEGPYYLVEHKGRFATTMGSLKTDESMQVLDTDGNLIKNLFAAGEVVNAVHGTNSPPGANLPWAVTSGYLAAEAILAGK